MTQEYIEYSSTNCSFDPATGIKTYVSKEKCDFAYQAQQKAFLVGAAPEVFERIDDFSFRTAVAETDFFMKNFKVGVLYNPISPELHKKLEPILKDNPFGINCPLYGNVDMARHNLGIYQGKVVLIDFC
jgi:hypothetical protein